MSIRHNLASPVRGTLVDINAHDKSQEEKSANILFYSWMFQNMLYTLFDNIPLTRLDMYGHEGLWLAAQLHEHLEVGRRDT